jgi:hypothetical protein
VVADGRDGASSKKPRALDCELGVSGCALVGDELAPGRAVVGRAVAGQSFELEGVFEDAGEGRFLAAGSPTGRAVSGQSFDDDAEVRVVVSFRGPATFVVGGGGGGFSAALARAARAAALFGSNRGGSVGFLT